MKRSPLSLIVLFLLIFLILIRLADVTISSTLNRYSPVIRYALQRNLRFDISFSGLDFSLFWGLRFRDFLIQADGQEVAYFKELRLRFSLLKLLSKKLAISRIIVEEGRTSIGIVRYKDYLIPRLQILAISDNYGFSGMGLASPKIYFHNLRIYLGRPAVNTAFVLVNSLIKLHRENLICKATLDLSDTNFNQSALKEWLFYKLSPRINAYLHLAFMREDLLVNNIILSSDNFKLNGAGIIYDFKTSPFTDIKFITVPLDLRELVNLKSKLMVNGLLNIIGNLRGGVRGFGLLTEITMAKSELYFPPKLVRLSNVYGNINFKNNEMIIKDLNALINYRFPVFIQGRVANFPNPEFQFRIEFYRKWVKGASRVETSNVILDIAAKMENNELIGNGSLQFISETFWPGHKKENIIKTDLKNLKLLIEGSPFVFPSILKCGIEELAVSLNNRPELSLNYLTSTFNINPHGLLNIEMQCRAYQGIIEGRGKWDLSGPAKTNFLLVRFMDLSADELKSILPTGAEISGTLKGFFYLSNDEPVFLRGAIAINNGRISSLNLIDNIASFLGIKSLKQLERVFMVVDFMVAKSGITIKRFNLHNETMDLRSQISINDKGWVTGEVNLTLPKEVLEESDILRKLISLVGEKKPDIGFDFRISGFVDAVRVELLEGEFRDRLIAGLGAGIRTQIENEIDKAIDSFSSRDLKPPVN